MKSLSQKALILIAMGFVVFAATKLYYLQEMLAALILFAVLSSVAAALLLIVLILDRAGEATVDFFELRAREALQHVRSRRIYSQPRSRF